LSDEILLRNWISSLDVKFRAVKREALVILSKIRDDPTADPDRIEEIVKW
jgi:hypothetical protein